MLGDLDSLRQGPQMAAPKSAVLFTHLLVRGHGQSPKVLRRQMLSGALDRASGPVCIRPCLITGRLQLGDAHLLHYFENFLSDLRERLTLLRLELHPAVMPISA